MAAKRLFRRPRDGLGTTLRPPGNRLSGRAPSGHAQEHGTKRTFFVVAKWDADANVFYSDSDIDGLHIEASTLEEFESLVSELAPDLIFENR